MFVDTSVSYKSFKKCFCNKKQLFSLQTTYLSLSFEYKIILTIREFKLCELNRFILSDFIYYGKI